MFKIDYSTYRTIKWFSHRVRFIVLHYTAANFKSSITTLTGQTKSQVSCHYLVPDPTDPTYVDAGFKEIRLFNLVNEEDRAWHAGDSYWNGRSDLNYSSIGIEIVYVPQGTQPPYIFPDYNPDQIEAIKQLTLNILQRYPDISPVNIVSHADIAPGRKPDLGPKFPWKNLYDAGIGAWHDEKTKSKYTCQFAEKLPPTPEVIEKLKSYGYDTSKAGTPSELQALLTTFQYHFRPHNYDGKLDTETAAILYALEEKYRNTPR